MADGTSEARLPESVIDNPRTGERFEFLPRADGDVLPFDFVVRPGGGVPMRHFHLAQRELFRCRSGSLTVHLSDGDRVLRAGDELELPPGAMHALTNAGDVDAVCYVEYRPAGRNEDWLKIVNSLERALGREPGLLDIAPFIGDVGIYIQGPPVWLQRVLFKALKALSTLIGRKRRALDAAQACYGRPFTWD